MERLARHQARKVVTLDRKRTGLDRHVGGLRRDAGQRLRRLERLLGVD